MGKNQTIEIARHPDGYAEVVSIDQLDVWLRHALITCRHQDATRMHRCAHAAVHAILCPCAWNEECIVDAVKSDLLCGNPDVADPEHDGPEQNVPETTPGDRVETEGRQRAEWLDQALDEALAATFPASDPVALN